MKIIHIINSLKKGGAEGNLYRLCKFQKKKYKNKINITIITLLNNGFYEKELKKLGVKIFSLNISKKIQIIDLIKKILIFRKFIKFENPYVIQSWMYHSNFMTIFAPKIFKPRIFWNIRHTLLNLQMSKKTTILMSIICGLFSRITPKKIIYCSEKSIFFHEKKHFYAKNKTALVYNGYSFKTYYPSNKLRLNFRKKNKIRKNDIVLGYAGRYAKEKNLKSLLIAFSKLVKNHKNICLYMVGKNINLSNRELSDVIKNLNITHKVMFLNEQRNLLKFYNGIDLLLLTSHSESFPNVVAESMLCSTPVLSSDVGCAKKIIGEYGFIITKNDHLSIEKKLNKFIKIYRYNKTKWKFFKFNSRLNIKKNFSIQKMSNSYLDTWVF